MLLSIHCPIADLDFLSENPKLIQCLIASGFIPPPSSKGKQVLQTKGLVSDITG